MRDRETLTVMALTDLISDPALKVRLQTRMEEVRENCQFARKWRNRRLAHTDLVTVREGRALACLRSLPRTLTLL
jgi:hypothetical protein